VVWGTVSRVVAAFVATPICYRYAAAWLIAEAMPFEEPVVTRLGRLRLEAIDGRVVADEQGMD
jgi:hypothetical protein